MGNLLTVALANLIYAAILYTLVFIALKREGRVASFKEYAQDMSFTSWIWKFDKGEDE